MYEPNKVMRRKCNNSFWATQNLPQKKQKICRVEAYSKPFQTSKTQHFLKIVNGFQLLTIFAKPFTLNAWQCSEYTFAGLLTLAL